MSDAVSNSGMMKCAQATTSCSSFCSASFSALLNPDSFNWYDMSFVIACDATSGVTEGITGGGDGSSGFGAGCCCCMKYVGTTPGIFGDVFGEYCTAYAPG